MTYLLSYVEISEIAGCCFDDFSSAMPELHLFLAFSSQNGQRAQPPPCCGATVPIIEGGYECAKSRGSMLPAQAQHSSEAASVPVLGTVGEELVGMATGTQAAVFNLLYSVLL